MPKTVYAGKANNGSCISNVENFMISQRIVIEPNHSYTFKLLKTITKN